MTLERQYLDRVDRVRAQVRATVPAGARVLVISRGDEALLRLDGRRAEHFPQTPTGLYAGHYPADGAEAAAHLSDLEASGAEYLVIPAEARWWLDHYTELRMALDERGKLLPGDPETALVYELTGHDQDDTSARLDAARTAPAVSSLLRALLPDGAGVVLIGPGADAVEISGRPCWRLPAESVEDVVEQARGARDAGARFVVLLHPDRPAEALDARLHQRVTEALRPVSHQRLAEIFEVPGA
jgi:hypothetical protein